MLGGVRLAGSFLTLGHPVLLRGRVAGAGFAWLGVGGGTSRLRHGIVGHAGRPLVDHQLVVGLVLLLGLDTLPLVFLLDALPLGRIVGLDGGRARIVVLGHSRTGTRGDVARRNPLMLRHFVLHIVRMVDRVARLGSSRFLLNMRCIQRRMANA